MQQDTSLKLIIAGSRGLGCSWELIEQLVHLYALYSYDMEVVSGGAKGIDRVGEDWAKHTGVKIKRFIPDWNQYGNYAGMSRNKDMGDYADCLLALWDGSSKGTAHMVEYMKTLNKPVVLITMQQINDTKVYNKS